MPGQLNRLVIRDHDGEIISIALDPLTGRDCQFIPVALYPGNGDTERPRQIDPAGVTQLMPVNV